MSTSAANANSAFIFPGSAQRVTGHSPPPTLQRMDWFQHHHQVNNTNHDASTPKNQNNSSSSSSTIMIENPLLRNLRTPLASIQPTTSNTDSNQQQQRMKSPPSTAHSTTSSLQPFSPFSPPPPSFLNLLRNTNNNNNSKSTISTLHHPVVDTDIFRHGHAAVGLRQRNIRSIQNASDLTDENGTLHTNHYHHHGDSSKKKIKVPSYINDPMSNPTSSSSYSLGNVPTLFALARPPSHDTAAVPPSASLASSVAFRYQTPSSWPLSTTTETPAPVVVVGSHDLWDDLTETKNQMPRVVTEQDITWGSQVTAKKAVHSIVPHDEPDILRPRSTRNDDDDENVASWCERIVRYLFRMDE